jgi:hypothetical protein
MHQQINSGRCRKELAMRGLLILIVLIVVLVLVGWITFSRDSGRASINVETNEIREDTGELMQKGSEVLQEAEEEVSPDAKTRDADEPVSTTTSR